MAGGAAPKVLYTSYPQISVKDRNKFTRCRRQPLPQRPGFVFLAILAMLQRDRHTSCAVLGHHGHSDGGSGVGGVIQDVDFVSRTGIGRTDDSFDEPRQDILLMRG
jgi:hypothetical protein